MDLGLLSPIPQGRMASDDSDDQASLSHSNGSGGQEVDNLAMAMTTGLSLQRRRARTIKTPASAARPSKMRMAADVDANDGAVVGGHSNDSSKADNQENIAPAGVTPSRLDRIKDLREELTCNVCLDILVRPCSTICGHTFCRSCLRESLKHSNNCPKCRAPQTGAPLKINTALWNTIQLLFPMSAGAAGPVTPEVLALKPSKPLAAIQHRTLHHNSVINQPFRPPWRRDMVPAGQAAAPAEDVRHPPRSHALPTQDTQVGARAPSPSASRLQALLDEMAGVSRHLDSQAPSQPQPSLHTLLAHDDRNAELRTYARVRRTADSVNPPSQPASFNPFFRTAGSAGTATGASQLARPPRTSLRRNSTPASSVGAQQDTVAERSSSAYNLGGDEDDSLGLQLLQRHSADQVEVEVPAHWGAQDAALRVPEHYRVPLRARDTGSDQEGARSQPALAPLRNHDAARPRDQSSNGRPPAAPVPTTGTDLHRRSWHQGNDQDISRGSTLQPLRRITSETRSSLEPSQPPAAVATMLPPGLPRPRLSIATGRAQAQQPEAPIQAYSDWTGDDDPTASDPFSDSPFFDAEMYQDARRAVRERWQQVTGQAAPDSPGGSMLLPIVIDSSSEDEEAERLAARALRREPSSDESLDWNLPEPTDSESDQDVRPAGSRGVMARGQPAGAFQTAATLLQQHANSAAMPAGRASLRATADGR